MGVKKAADRFSRVSPSSLPTLEQCERAFAIQRDYKAARKAHPDLPKDGDDASVPMVFGSALHRVMEDGSWMGRSSKAVRKSLDKVLGKSDPEYDSTYRNRNDLVGGLVVALKAFLSAPESAPWRDGSARMVEQRVEAEIDGVKVSGFVDCVDEDGMVCDIKTTTPSADSDYGSQLTAYWMLAREAMEDVSDDACVVKVFRPYGPKGASGVQAEFLSAKANERHVRGLLAKARRIGETKKEWKSDYTRLPCNPAAKRCRYCPAKQTSACPETRRW